MPSDKPTTTIDALWGVKIDRHTTWKMVRMSAVKTIISTLFSRSLWLELVTYALLYRVLEQYDSVPPGMLEIVLATHGIWYGGKGVKGYQEIQKGKSGES